MNQKHNRRFYKKVSTEAVDDGFGIFLDGRRLKTPGKSPLTAPNAYIAALIAAEWEAQSELIRPETMPVTRLVNVSIELTPGNRGKLIAEARSYGETDLLCYRTSDPAALSERQSKQWDPILDWARQNEIELNATTSLIAVDQPKASLDRIADYASRQSDLLLTLFVHLTAVFGSVVLAMAVLEGHLEGERAFHISRLDALFQIEKWGEDEEAAENAKTLETEVIALCRILVGDK